MRHTILNGDVIACLRSLPDACVQCVVTSPPYWGLRDYGVEGQIGLEPTPEEHVEKMVEVFREVKRVLRDDGTLWLNYGDCYAASGRKDENGCSNRSEFPEMPGRSPSGPLKPKDLVGMPWRIAFALQADGWYLRSDIIWSKPNPMPESATDRPTKSHEYVFLLAKQARYFYDADAIREPYAESTFKRAKSVNNAAARKDNGTAINQRGLTAEQQTKTYSKVTETGGRNKRSVWHIATQSFSEAHFATFPEALVEPCIKAGTSERGACPKCGAPWRRVVERVRDHGLAPVAGGKTATLAETDRWNRLDRRRKAARAAGEDPDNPFGHGTTLGWQPTCTCGGDPVPCVVLDPFGGSGTVAKVARDLGRSSILIEINPEYVQIAKKRLRIGEQLDSGVCEYVVKNFRTEATP
ncbi:MAG: site-specific DNA-methyltransferase [Patescibacteria group bacterium]